jgi:multiple sugar transport system permease protein
MTKASSTTRGATTSAGRAVEPVVAPPERNRVSQWRRRVAFTLFVSPALVAVGVTLLFPIGYNIWLSFRRYNLASPYLGNRFVGLHNYLTTIRSPDFWNALQNTGIVTAACLLIEVPVGLALAMAVNRRLRGHRLFQFVFLLPLLVVPVVAAFMWRFIFQYDGVANYVLGLVNLGPVNWAGQSTGLLTIIVAVTWQNTPFTFIVCLAGLQSVDPSLIDAAHIDGASPMKRLWHIILPLMRPFLLIILSIRTMDLLRVFDVGYILTGGGPGRTTELLSQLAYTNSFTYFDLGTGSAISIIQTVLIIICLAAFFVLFNEGGEHEAR